MKQDNFNFPDIKTYRLLEVVHSNGRIIVYINGSVKYDFEKCDKASFRFVAVHLYLQWKINQNVIGKEFNISSRTLFNWINNFKESGIDGLRDKTQGPPVKVDESVKQRVLKLRYERETITEISRKMFISVGKVWSIINENSKNECDVLPGLEVEDTSEITGEEQEIEVEVDDLPEVEESADPLNRSTDRMYAFLGLEEDAKPIFANTPRTEFVGVFLAIALLSHDVFFEKMLKVYRTMGPAFYGLRNFFMTLFLMAFLRIKNPEKSGYYNVLTLGRLLGLDRSPCVKTIRRKIKHLSYRRKAMELMHLLGKERLNTLDQPLAVLYVDGHVISYYGKRKLGKTFSTSKNRVVSATTEYWVNLADGTPLLFIPAEFNSAMTSAFFKIAENARKVCGGRPITFVFDRGGCSAALFEKLIAQGYDFIAYNKGANKLDDANFIEEKTIINGKEYSYKPYSREINKDIYVKDKNGVYRKTKRKVKVREVIVRRNDGGQTSIITSRKDLSSAAVAAIIFNRWTQENYLKYLKEKYALDHLCTYAMLPVNENINHPNPEYTAIKKKIEKLNKSIESIVGKHMKDEIDENEPSIVKNIVKLKTGKKADILKKMKLTLEHSQKLLKSIPPRISASEYKRINSESRLITNLVKMTAYYIEGKLAEILSFHYKGCNGNARGLISAMLRSPGSIKVDNGLLNISIAPQSTPEKTRILKATCNEITVLAAKFPGTDLRMVFQVDPQL